MKRIIIVFLILSTLILNGCLFKDPGLSENYITYEINGEIVKCKYYAYSKYCGMTLRQCENNTSYDCVTNLKIIG